MSAKETLQYLKQLRENHSLFDVLQYVKNINEGYSVIMVPQPSIDDQLQNELKQIILDSQYWIGLYSNRNENLTCYYILSGLEIQIDTAFYKNIIDINTYLDFKNAYLYFLTMINRDKMASVQCKKIISYYILNKNTIENELKNKNEINSYPTSYNIFLKNMIKIAKAGVIASNKLGIRDEISFFNYFENYFYEKIYFNLYNPPSDHIMISAPQWVIEPLYNVFNVVLDEKYKAKGYKLMKLNCKIFLKAVSLYIFRKTSGYSERPFKLIFWGFIILILFGLIFQIFELTNSNNFFENMFISFSYLSNFGNDSSLIKNSFSLKVLIILEVTLGIIITNLFLVFLTKKWLK